MPIRNPFARRPGTAAVSDENARPVSSSGDALQAPGFERADTVGSKASSALSIRSQDNGEYKMSVVNDSGVYLPPSPATEKEPSWPRRYIARNSTDTRSDVGEIEHFSISRESFDSYRRSFDISARSPIISSDTAPTRQSLDSARFPRRQRAPLRDRQRLDQKPPTTEEAFEDVGLNDDTKPQQPQAPARKRGFFKFGSEHPDGHAATATATATAAGGSGAAATGTPSSMSRFLMTGRKRAQSGQGAELGNMDRPKTAGSVVEVQETAAAAGQ